MSVNGLRDYIIHRVHIIYFFWCFTALLLIIIDSCYKYSCRDEMFFCETRSWAPTTEASRVSSVILCLCVPCVTVEPPRQNDVQPPAPSSSPSQAPPAPSSSRYRERRSRRAHRGGGTRDDRYRSGQRPPLSDALIADQPLFHTSSDAPFTFLGHSAL